MRKFYFVSIFIFTHIFFIFFQIHKHSKVIRLSYCKQKNEQHKEELTQKIQDLTQQLYTLQEREAIKKYAQENMGMRKVRLSQVKKLNLSLLRQGYEGQAGEAHAKTEDG